MTTMTKKSAREHRVDHEPAAPPVKHVRSPPPQSRGPEGRFRKGASGNPGGQPKGLRELRAKLREHADEMVDALLETIRSGTGSTRLEAIKVGLAYVYGKPPDGFDPDALTDEELLAVVRKRAAEEKAEEEAGDKEISDAAE